jgi:hypothetical protein
MSYSTRPDPRNNQEVTLDRAALRYAERDTYGSAAMHGLDPAEICARIEERAINPLAGMREERSHLRNEVLAGFIEYVFCDGPEPEAVRQRIAGFIESFSEETAAAIGGPERWVSPNIVRRVLRKREYRAKLAELSRARREGNLSAWWRELEAERDRECVCGTIVAIVEYITCQGKTWKAIVATAYVLAKSFHPHLIAGMSLEDIAVLSGDGGRATPSLRVKRLINQRLAAAGAKACGVNFQKSASAIASYAEAQKGNTNRRKH